MCVIVGNLDFILRWEGFGRFWAEEWYDWKRWKILGEEWVLRGEVWIREFVHVNVSKCPSGDAELAIKYISLDESQERGVDYNYKFGNSQKKVFKTYVLDENTEEVIVDREGKTLVAWNSGAF